MEIAFDRVWAAHAGSTSEDLRAQERLADALLVLASAGQRDVESLVRLAAIVTKRS
jgi:hypothetical protein